MSPLPFPQSLCAACGYSLQGLPPTGPCPECGEPYDDESFILFGWHASRFRVDPIYKLLYIVAFCFSIFLWLDVVFAILGTIASLILRTPRTATGGMLLLTAAYAAAATALLYVARKLRSRADRAIRVPASLGKPALQLRLSHEGYAFKHGLGHPHTLLHWRPDLELDLTLEGPIARIRIARNSPLGTTDWSTLVDLAFPASSDQVANLKKYIEQLRSDHNST